MAIVEPASPATSTGAGRPAPSRAEARALAVVAVALVGFAIGGYAAGMANTTSYLLVVVALAASVGWVRREPLPDLLAYGLALDAVAHLAGGLVRVGHGVLYNAGVGGRSARLGTHVLQYDHVVHAYGSMVATVAIWVLLVRPAVRVQRPGHVVVVCVLAGLGVGALNELIEFVATLLRSGSSVGGYANTGWDLAANAAGGLLGGLVVRRHLLGDAAG